MLVLFITIRLQSNYNEIYIIYEIVVDLMESDSEYIINEQTNKQTNKLIAVVLWFTITAFATAYHL